MKKIYKSLAITSLLITIFIVKVEAKTSSGEISFYDVSQICYESTVYLGDLVYLKDGSSFDDYLKIMISIKEPDGNNSYLYYGAPDSLTKINIKESEYEDVESYTSTSITLSFMLYFSDGSAGDVYSKSYNFVRGMDSDFSLPSSVSPIDSDGNFLSSIPLSDIFGDGIAENATISCSTAEFSYLNGTAWNISYLQDGMNKWNTNHSFTVEGATYLGCGSETTITTKTKLIPEIIINVPSEAILDYDSVLLTDYVEQPLSQTVSSVTYTGTFSSSASITDDNYLLTDEIDDTTGCEGVTYYIKQYTSSGTLYNTASSTFYLPLDGPFVEFSMDNAVACNGESFQITIDDNDLGHDYMLVVEDDTLDSPSSYTIEDFSEDIDVYLIEEKTSACTISQSLTIHADSVVADFTVSEESIAIGDYVTFTSTSTNASEYYWTFNEGDHSDLENPSHYFYTAGAQNVSLEVTSENGCTDTYSNESALIVESNSDIDVTELDQLTVWPNPVSDNLYYTTNKNQINTLEILNITGGVVKIFEASAFTNSVNVADLTPGVYMLLIGDSESVQVVKFIKE